MKDFAGNDAVDFWRFQQSGFFYQRTAMRPSSRKQEDGVIQCAVDFRAIAVYIGEAINCLTRLYEGMAEDSDVISLVLALLGTQDRQLTSGVYVTTAAPLYDHYICRIPEVTVKRRYSLAEWRAGIVDHALDIADEVYKRFNWMRPNLIAAKDAIERLFARKL